VAAYTDGVEQAATATTPTSTRDTARSTARLHSASLRANSAPLVAGPQRPLKVSEYSGVVACMANKTQAVARLPGPRLLLLRPLHRLAIMAARAQPNGASVAEKGGMAPLAASQARLASSTASITRSVSERCVLEYKARTQLEEGAFRNGVSVT
jgi:hypothetical protein